MTATPRLPNPLTLDGLRGLMRERPYWNTNHPRAKIYHRIVQRGFEILYPGKVRYGPGGRIDVGPLPPEKVAHLVAEANREMDEGWTERPSPQRRGDMGEPGGAAGGADGTVHVRAYTQTRAGIEERRRRNGRRATHP